MERHGEPRRTRELSAPGPDLPGCGSRRRAGVPVAGAERGARLPRGRGADRPLRPLADRRARDGGERRRDRRGTPAVHRRARTAPVAARLDAPGHLRPRHGAAGAVRPGPRGGGHPRRAAHRGGGGGGDRARPLGHGGGAATAGGTGRPRHRVWLAGLRGAAVPGSQRGGHPRADAARRLGGARDRRPLARGGRGLHRAGARRHPRGGAGGALRPEPVLPPARGEPCPRGDDGGRPPRGARHRDADGEGRPVDGHGRLPRRHPAGRVELPPPARSRHRAVPRDAARPVLHERRHVDRRRPREGRLAGPVRGNAGGDPREGRPGGRPVPPVRLGHDRRDPGGGGAGAGGRVRLRAPAPGRRPRPHRAHRDPLRRGAGGADHADRPDPRQGSRPGDRLAPLPGEQHGGGIAHRTRRGRRRGAGAGDRLRPLRADPDAGSARRGDPRHGDRQGRRAVARRHPVRLPHLLRRRHPARRAARRRHRQGRTGLHLRR